MLNLLALGAETKRIQTFAASYGLSSSYNLHADGTSATVRIPSQFEEGVVMVIELRASKDSNDESIWSTAWYEADGVRKTSISPYFIFNHITTLVPLR
jgi:hypothetical protein